VTEHGSNGGHGEGAKSSVIGEMSRPAQMAVLPEILEFVSTIERQEGFSDERIGEIEKALREALVNIVRSAERQKGGDIIVTCKHDPWGKLVIVIVDTAEPFNILLADIVFQGEETPVDEGRRDSARLIKRMIDNIEQKRVDETNVLTFTVSPRLRAKQQGR
jgi:anti-sigma regulatory factor (Ser/Thr protein kinase)